MIQFPCESCGTQITAPDEAAGKTGKCRQCGHSNTIPSAAEQRSSPTDALEAALAPEEPAAAQAAPSPAAAAATAPPQRISRRARKRRTVRRILIVSLLCLAGAGAAAYFAWPKVWEHFNASTIYALEVDARTCYLKGEYSKAKQQYAKLFALVGNSSRHSPELQKVLNRARETQQSTQQALIAATTQPGAAPGKITTLLNVDGLVYLNAADKGTQYLAGVEVHILHPIASRSTLLIIYNQLRDMAHSAENEQMRNANALKAEARSQTNPLAEEWQTFVLQDLKRADAFHNFQTEMDLLIKEPPGFEDLETLRQEILHVNLEYRVAAGSAGPRTDITHDMAGTDFDEIVRVTHVISPNADAQGHYAVMSAVTDEKGHYVIPNLPAGNYYIYAYWQEGRRHAEWLLPEQLYVGPNININLRPQNAKALSN